MKRKTRKQIVWYCTLVCCWALPPSLSALDEKKETSWLHMEGDYISAQIANVSLSEVARALEKKAGIEVQLETSGLKEHPINAQFAKLERRAALKEVLKDMNYLIVGEPDRSLRVFVYSLRREDHEVAVGNEPIDSSLLP